MKFEAIKEKILLARESNVQHLVPYDSFLEKTGAAEALVDFMEQQEADPEIIQQARWYFVVICVSAMEIYFKGTAEIFIQGGWYKDTFLEILRQDKISLADLVKMDKEKFTLGEIISVSHGFQSLDSINIFYSRMLGCNDFVKEVSEFKAPLREGKYFILMNDRPEFRNDIHSLVNSRHRVIHSDTFKRTLSAKRLHKMTGSLIDFVYAADFYLMNASGEYTEV